MIDLYASHPHYWSHLAPIWHGLDASVRGDRWENSDMERWGGNIGSETHRDASRVILTAGFVDVQRLGNQPIVYLEHGAGQAYPGDRASRSHGSHSGGKGHDYVRLFLAPNFTVAERWGARYNARVEVIGCPRLARPWPTPIRPTVCFTWHWDNTLVPETRTALPHYAEYLALYSHTLKILGYRVIGTAHPRLHLDWRALYRAAEIEAVEDSDLALSQATVVVGDNTSLLYEAAAIGRAVVCLNAPWYRRDVEHGLRFWSMVPGPQVDEPNGLYDALIEAQDQLWADVRRKITAAVYPERHGTDRAVRAIHALHNEVSG